MILQITLRAGWGGAPKHIDSIISNLKDKYILYTASPLEKPYGIKWKRELGENNFFETPFRAFSFIKLMELKSFVKKNGIKIVHAHGKGAGLYARLLKILYPQIKVIFTFHGFHIGAYGPIKRSLYIFYERILEKYTNLYLNVSEGERSVCLAYNIYSEKKSQIIYNAVPFTEVNSDKQSLRNKLNLPPDKNLVLTTTRFDFQKNMEASVKIAELFKDDHDYLFIWVGDGKEKQAIENVIKIKKLDNIFLTGFKDNPLDYIAACDLYLSTSRWEGLPYSLIESTMLGLPAVVTNVTGNNEVIINNYNGILYNLDDLKSAENHIKKICNNPELHKRFSDNSKKIFSEKFSINKMISSIDNIYQKYLTDDQ